MPLTWNTITSASKVMLPVYLATYALLGLELLLQDPQRTSTPAFDPAKLLMTWLPNPMQGWGVVFLAIATYEALALARRQRIWEVTALGLGLGMAAFWMTLLLVAAGTDDRVSYTSGTWLLIPVAAHFASMISLTRREGAAR